MTLFLDLVVLAVLVLGALLGWKRGFLKTAIIAASGIISLLVSLFLAKPISNLLSFTDLPEIANVVLAFIILYFVIKLLLRFTAGLLTKLLDRPVLRKLNTVLGIILGVVLAIFRIFIFCFIANAIIEIAGALDIGFFKNIDPDDTILFNFFNNINIFNLLF